MRAAYAYRILMGPENELREKVLTLMEEQKKMGPEDQEYFNKTWMMRFEQRAPFFQEPKPEK